MTLPALDIPITLPIELPLLVHPITVHFAIVLPIVILLLELSNLVFKRRALSVTSLLFMLLVVLVYFAAFFTGKVDGSEAGPLLSAAGKEELQEHKLIGTYLVYATILLVAVKSFSMLIARGWAKGLFFLVLVLFIAASLKQGKDGGELVYEYGANNAMVSTHEDTIDDLNDKIEELEEQLEQSKAVSGATVEAVKEVQKELGNSVDTVVDATSDVVEAVTDYVNKTAQSVSKAVKEVVGDVNSSASDAAASETADQNSSSPMDEAVPVSMPQGDQADFPRGTIATH